MTGMPCWDKRSCSLTCNELYFADMLSIVLTGAPEVLAQNLSFFFAVAEPKTGSKSLTRKVIMFHSENVALAMLGEADGYLITTPTSVTGRQRLPAAGTNSPAKYSEINLPTWDAELTYMIKLRRKSAYRATTHHTPVRSRPDRTPRPAVMDPRALTNAVNGKISTELAVKLSPFR